MNSANIMKNMEVLEKIIHKKVRISEVDDKTKQELIALCKARKQQLDKKYSTGEKK